MDRRTVRAHGADIVYAMILDADLQVHKHDFIVQLSHSVLVIRIQNGSSAAGCPERAMTSRMEM